jgi:hypothetical protein
MSFLFLVFSKVSFADLCGIANNQFNYDELSWPLYVFKLKINL